MIILCLCHVFDHTSGNEVDFIWGSIFVFKELVVPFIIDIPRYNDDFLHNLILHTVVLKRINVVNQGPDPIYKSMVVNSVSSDIES